jgi:hypothetical protein
MHDRFGTKLIDDLIDEAMVAEVSDMEPDRLPGGWRSPRDCRTCR